MLRLKLVAFAVVTLLGIGFVAVRYMHVADGAYTVYADLPAAGGLFPNASVSYRGVPIGRVSSISLHGTGVRAALRLNHGVRVPRELTAVVAHRSAVGEQYLDLRPSVDSGPYLAAGSIIALSQTRLPLPVETLLEHLDALVGSVDPADLRTLFDALGTAFEGNETALRTLLDANDLLLTDAARSLPETVSLIDDGATVLQTQIDSASAIRRFAAALAQLSATVRSSDSSLRTLLANGPTASAELLSLLRGLDPSIGPLLGNLVTVNGIAVRRLPGIEQILVEYPLVVAGGFSVAPGDGTAHLGLVANVNDPPPCNYRSTGQAYTCTGGERARGSGVRSSANAPRGGPPPRPAAAGPSASSEPSTSFGGSAPAFDPVAGFDPVTGLVLGPDGQPIQMGGTGGQAATAGDQSWKLLLLAGLSR